MPNILTHPVHLGLGARVIAQPVLSGMDWYIDYGQRVAADGAEGRLVMMYRFSESWTSWEMHPHGEELVLCTEGEMTLIQEFPDGRRESITIGAGDYAINPAGVWHTADITGEAAALFVTAGMDTENRPR